eukprot:1805301-Rhodomonas_salina.1
MCSLVGGCSADASAVEAVAGVRLVLLVLPGTMIAETQNATESWLAVALASEAGSLAVGQKFGTNERDGPGQLETEDKTVGL